MMKISKNSTKALVHIKNKRVKKVTLTSNQIANKDTIEQLHNPNLRVIHQFLISKKRTHQT